MPSTAESNQRIRGLFGTGFVSWILLSIALFIPEWTRDREGKHCGVTFCCMKLYGNCTITDTAVVADEFSYIFASWLMTFVAICSSTCRCTEVKPENIRQMAVLLVVGGILALTGSVEFFIRKFTNEELDFSAGGFIAHIAGWMLFIAGCCGFCHGYDYSEDLDGYGNSVYPFDMGPRMFGGGGFSRFDPVNFARRKWREMQNMRTMSSNDVIPA